MLLLESPRNCVGLLVQGNWVRHVLGRKAGRTFGFPGVTGRAMGGCGAGSERLASRWHHEVGMGAHWESGRNQGRFPISRESGTLPYFGCAGPGELGSPCVRGNQGNQGNQGRFPISGVLAQGNWVRHVLGRKAGRTLGFPGVTGREMGGAAREASGSRLVGIAKSAWARAMAAAHRASAMTCRTAERTRQTRCFGRGTVGAWR
jgi:hypothetical protein